MLWPEIRKAYPNEWLVVEALEAHTDPDNLRHFDRLAIVEKCKDGSMAMKHYRKLHIKYPQREFYFVHTDRPELNIHERRWVGISRATASSISGEANEVGVNLLDDLVGVINVRQDGSNVHDKYLSTQKRS